MWDDALDITSNLAKAVDEAEDASDTAGVASICDSLIARLKRSDQPYPEREARRSLAKLRRKRMFALMQRLADAFIQTGQKSPQIRRQYAQSLLDQHMVTAAIDVLERLLRETADGPEHQAENVEARGLLGRAYKQLYVEGGDSTTKRARDLLNQATRFYYEVYITQPQIHVWHGINVVALMCRAQRDGVPLEDFGDARKIAADILNEVKGREAEGQADLWAFAAAAEACIAMELPEDAIRWTDRYLRNDYVDAFEVGSIRRQFLEVWQLNPRYGVGAQLLPILESRLLRLSGSQMALDPRYISESPERTAGRGSFERVLGDTSYLSLASYDTGRRRCLAVARIETELDSDRGVGTGFLVLGKSLRDSLGDRLLMMTNAHVVSDDTNVKDALRPEDAYVSLKALDGQQRYRVNKILWTSPPGKLDATLVELDATVSGVEPYPIAAELPVPDASARVYIIGHPKGGGLSFSLNDNRLLDYQDHVLHYRAPTEGGSSGSPVFNSVWKLIGIHHAGGLDMQKLNGKPGTYAANEGIWIQSIRRALESQSL